MNSNEQSNFVDSIRKEDRVALLEIYKIYFPQTRHYIMANSGNVFDAEDVFQDALVLIYLKIKKNTLNLKNSFGSYLYGVVKFLWLKELERKRKYFGTSVEDADLLLGDIDFLEDYVKMEKRKLVLEHYNELNEECKKILDLHIKETPISISTAIMGYASDQYTMNRKSKCKSRLFRAVWNNPRYKELKDELNQQDTKVPRW